MRMVTEAEVRHIAHLARLRLEDAQAAQLSTQLSTILDYFQQLQSVDTSAVPATTHPLPRTNALRDDLPSHSLPQDAVLRNAPMQEAGCFTLPKVLDGGGA